MPEDNAIQMAEQVEALRAENARLREAIRLDSGPIPVDFPKLRAENEKLREALMAAWRQADCSRGECAGANHAPWCWVTIARPLLEAK